MSDVAYKSMLNKTCISTANCTGKYDFLDVVQVNGEPVIKVTCTACNQQIDRYIPAQFKACQSSG